MALVIHIEPQNLSEFFELEHDMKHKAATDQAKKMTNFFRAATKDTKINQCPAPNELKQK